METVKILTPKDIQCMFSIGKNQAYALMNSAGFPSVKLNNRLFVTEEAMSSWLATYKGRQYLF